MAEEPKWDDPRWRLTRNYWCRMWGPIPIDLIWGAFLTFVFGMYLLAALFLGIAVVVAVWAWSGPVTTERQRWRFWRQPELGPMYGPIPIVWMLFIVTAIARYIYFDVILE